MLQARVRIRGKWTQEPVEIIDSLGAGANGEVYLVRYTNGHAAMKVCDRAGDIAFEWSLLEKLDRLTDCFPKPLLIDDDENHNIYFYLMEKVAGKPLSDVFQQLQPMQIHQLLLNISQGLSDLHRTKHAFCDVKPQNMLVLLGRDAAVRFVDVGGVTPFGRSVRQFTPYYDRAYWGMGTRTADAAYDLFGMVLVFICLATPPPQTLVSSTVKQRQVWLQKALAKFPLPNYVHVFNDVIAGKVSDAKSLMIILNSMGQPDRTKMNIAQPATGAFKSLRPRHVNWLKSQGRARRSVQAHDWTERFMWASICCAVIASVAAWASFLNLL